jgi:predicted kinase
MKEIIILVGNIGSGKSTLAKEYAKKGYVIISRDSLRYMIGGGNYRFDKKLEPFIKQSAVEVLRVFLRSGQNLVYDETNVSKSLRKPTIQLAKIYGYKVVAVVLPRLSKEVSVARRLKTPHGNFSKKTWEWVWEQFDTIFEMPEKSEGIDRIIKRGK